MFLILDHCFFVLFSIKCFYYFGFGVMKDVAFALFALSWYITRNTLYWYFPVCMAYQNYYVHNKAFCDGHHAGECYGGGLLLILLAGLGVTFFWKNSKICSVFFLFFSSPRIFAIFSIFGKRAKNFPHAGCDCAHTKKCPKFSSVGAIVYTHELGLPGLRDMPAQAKFFGGTIFLN